MFQSKYNLIAIIGPTAGGKTSVAAHLANKIDGEIISADSRQVYKKMNIGTGKDYNDYIINGYKIPYHLIDIKEPGYKYNVFEYQNDFIQIYYDIINRSKFPILCGGTGLYIEAVTKGYRMLEVPPDYRLRDELEKLSLQELTDILLKYKKLHNKTDIDTKKRAIRAIEIEKYHFENNKKASSFPNINYLLTGIKFEREYQRKQITLRLEKRLKNGMIEEVENLLNKDGISPEELIYYGLEYKYLTLYVIGKISYDEMFIKLNTSIHQFAKRQMTWFRHMEKQGQTIYWLDGNMPIDEKVKLIINKIKKD